MFLVADTDLVELASSQWMLKTIFYRLMLTFASFVIGSTAEYEQSVCDNHNCSKGCSISLSTERGGLSGFEDENLRDSLGWQVLLYRVTHHVRQNLVLTQVLRNNAGMAIWG